MNPRSRIISAVDVLFGALMVVGLAFVFSRPILDVLRIASSDPERAYNYVGPFVAAYLAWLRRSRIHEIRIRRSWAGCIWIIAGWLICKLGGLNDVMFMWHAGFLISVVGVIVTFFGSSVLRPFGAAFFIIFTMVPLPGTVRQIITQPLQGFATSVTSVIFEITGIPTEQAGNLITINGVTVAVGEACDGMRLVVPLAIVIFAFVFSLPLRLRIRMLLILASVPVALVCNVIRLIPTSLAYGYAPGIAESVHDISGWGMIPLAILLLLGFLRTIEWLDIPVSRWRLVTA